MERGAQRLVEREPVRRGVAGVVTDGAAREVQEELGRGRRDHPGRRPGEAHRVADDEDAPTVACRGDRLRGDALDRGQAEVRAEVKPHRLRCRFTFGETDGVIGPTPEDRVGGADGFLGIDGGGCGRWRAEDAPASG